MMELGATVCLPRAPLCLQCPVHALCHTRGEHATPARTPQRSLPVACLLDLRKRGPATEVLLSLSPGQSRRSCRRCLNCRRLPLEAVEGREPVLRVRHAITNTNYYVQVFSPQRHEPGAASPRRSRCAGRFPKASAICTGRACRDSPGLPLTGLDAQDSAASARDGECPRINLLEG